MFGKKIFNDYELNSLNVLANYDVQVRISPDDPRFASPEPESIAAIRRELAKRGILPPVAPLPLPLPVNPERGN